MKIGCCTNMVASSNDGTGIERIEVLKELGYDYIELPLAQMVELPDSKFDLMKRRVDLSGLKCEACNNFFPPYVRLTGNDVNHDIIEKYLDIAIDRARQLGVKIIVFGSAGAKNVPDGYPKEKAFGEIVSLLQSISERIKADGITIVIEPLNKLEGNIINTVEEGFDLVKTVNKQNVKLLADYYHMVLEEEDILILKTCKKFIKHVHFSRPEGRVFPKESEKENYSYFFKKLKQIGYDERISIEAYTDNFYTDAESGLKVLRSFF